MRDAGAGNRGESVLSVGSERIRQTSHEQRVNFEKTKYTLLDLCVSSLRRGHANILCIVPIVTDDP